jgi:hypothetical protein
MHKASYQDSHPYPTNYSIQGQNVAPMYHENTEYTQGMDLINSNGDVKEKKMNYGGP